MARNSKKQWQPASWQIDPASIDSKMSHVQFWRNGIMVTAQMSVDNARQAVKDGNAFVISAQAIGAIIDGRPCS